MEHRFYQKNESEQKRILQKTGAVLFVMSIIILAISYLTDFYLLIFLIPVFILIAAPFIDLPMGKKSGKFIYYSPLFITEEERNNKVTVHGGTLFDYVYTIKPDMQGRERTQFVLYGYISGLVNFVSVHENQNKDNLKVRGTSYIINRRTARRFGLQPVQKDFLQILLLLFNYIPITISYSFLKQKLQFPKMSDVQTYEGTLSEIAAHKEELIRLKNRLKPE
ncbi:hypothetical protein [Rhodohalobacter sp.]|uniref:hypothetical protein n=1 Tax=Rhodohalobacter sp. TaxID=1974210 RepID=UPI002ACDC521|nr:hypothetical protein [Rhodohalobacter sp.]MDZ7756451.1 hypothetical protein [Rhodohalobacter sp.]